MGDVDDAQVLRPKVADDHEQILDLFLGKSCRRLVENDDLRFVGNRFRDLAHLLFADGQVAHLGSGIDIDMKLIEKLSGLFDHLLVIDHDALFEFTADENILCNGQVADHVQLLVNDDDTGCLCFMRIVKFDFFSFVCDGSGILRINTGKHLHESGFTCTVFSHQSMDLTAPQFQIHMIQCMNAGEGFVDTFHC